MITNVLIILFKQYTFFKISSSSFGSSSNSSDDDDDIVDCDLKPIKEYIGNRREMAKQLFISVKSDKVRMMLPQVLKVIIFKIYQHFKKLMCYLVFLRKCHKASWKSGVPMN